MSGYLRRLATTGAAYTAASILSKLIAVALLPLYTRYLTPADYGAAEVMFAAIVSASIVVRFGLIEALLRFYYKDDEDPDRVVASTFAGLFWLATLGALIALPFATPISEAAARPPRLRPGANRDRRPLGADDVRVPAHPLPARGAGPGLLRDDDRQRPGTIALTVVLVVGADEGARGLLLGSYASGAAFVLGLIVLQRRRLSLRFDPPLLRRLLRFGLPTMPAEASLYLLNFVDRIIIVRTVGLAEAGLYSLAVKFAQAVNVLVRGFQLAWPPLAYSIRDDDEARRAYATVVTLFVAGCAFVVTGIWLFSRWIVRALAAPEFFDSYEAVGLIATAVTLYALYMVLVVILGRTGRTEFNFPAAARRPRRQRRPQPDPGPVARHRRRRPRPGRLLPRRAGADVRLHPAPLPGALPVGSPGPGGSDRGRPGRRRGAVDADLRRRRPARARCPLRRLPPRPLRQRLLHPRRAGLAGAPAPPR